MAMNSGIHDAQIERGSARVPRQLALDRARVAHEHEPT